MDQNSQNFEEKKKSVINSITGILIDALEKGVVLQDEAKEISTFILDKKEGMHDEITLNAFLEELATKWSLYKNYSDSYNKTEQFNNVDKQKLDMIKSQLDQLSKVSN